MKKALKVGDRVKYRVAFLRSIGAYTGAIPFARGTVVSIKEFFSGFTLAEIEWDNSDVQRVNVCNITHVSDPETASY